MIDNNPALASLTMGESYESETMGFIDLTEFVHDCGRNRGLHCRL